MARTYVDRKGYRRFSDSGKSVHRWVKSKELGRKPSSRADVHHRDGNKLNNRPSNLRLINKSEHSSYHARKRKSRW